MLPQAIADVAHNPATHWVAALSAALARFQGWSPGRMPRPHALPGIPAVPFVGRQQHLAAVWDGAGQSFQKDRRAEPTGAAAQKRRMQHWVRVRSGMYFRFRSPARMPRNYLRTSHDSRVEKTKTTRTTSPGFI